MNKLMYNTRIGYLIFAIRSLLKYEEDGVSR